MHSDWPVSFFFKVAQVSSRVFIWKSVTLWPPQGHRFHRINIPPAAKKNYDWSTGETFLILNSIRSYFSPHTPHSSFPVLRILVISKKHPMEGHTEIFLLAISKERTFFLRRISWTTRNSLLTFQQLAVDIINRHNHRNVRKRRMLRVILLDSIHQAGVYMHHIKGGTSPFHYSDKYQCWWSQVRTRAWDAAHTLARRMYDHRLIVPDFYRPQL